MSTEPYVITHPGDLITAELFNGVQEKIKEDIGKQIDEAVKGIKSVDQAGDAGKLGGKTPDELVDEVVKKALAELSKKESYYQLIFKRLRKNEQVVLKHNFDGLPLVDVYQLDYFEVICAEGEEKEDRENKFVNFYLYHTDEREQKSTLSTGPKKINIEPTDGKHEPFKIRFDRMLAEVGVKPTETQSLGDIVTEFWDALFSMPNCDQFDPDQYCHSPWFQKCCGENRSYAQLKARNNWDEIWFQMRPRKQINFPWFPPAAAELPPILPNNVEVVHLDFDKVGVELLRAPVYSKELVPATGDPKINKDELKVMILLKGKGGALGKGAGGGAAY
jgi:hypothetical protein